MKRFCTACDCWLLVSEFATGPRRYSCKKHQWLNAGKKAKAKRLASIAKRLLFRIWGTAYDDSKRFSGTWKTLQDDEAHPKNRAHIDIKQIEIEQLLSQATNYHSKEVYDNPMEFARRVAILPRNPEQMLSFDNAAVVTNILKRRLFRAWKLGGSEAYTSEFIKAAISDKNVFVPSREQLKTMETAMNVLIDSGGVLDNSIIEGGGGK